MNSNKISGLGGRIYREQAERKEDFFTKGTPVDKGLRSRGEPPLRREKRSFNAGKGKSFVRPSPTHRNSPRGKREKGGKDFSSSGRGKGPTRKDNGGRFLHDIGKQAPGEGGKENAFLLCVNSGREI